ncbi:MAG: phosphatase PAP2 family protein [Nitrospirae bacterium]|nr:phosphatase PAP2 family protein [Nitrospirota bacterium]
MPFSGRSGSTPSPLLIGAAALLVIAGLWELIQLDPFIRDAIRPWRTPWVLAVMSRVTFFGQGWVLGAIGAVVAAIGYRFRRRVLVRMGVVSIAALITSGLADRVLKIAFGRPRPRLVDDGVVEWSTSLVSGHHSFPSGHAVSAFTLAVVFAAWRPSWRPALLTAATAIALSRVVLDAHFFSDVVAGALVGAVVGWGVVVLAARRWPEPGATSTGR